MERQILDRQTDRQNRQIERQAYRIQIDRYIGRQIYRQTDIDIQIDRYRYIERRYRYIDIYYLGLISTQYNTIQFRQIIREIDRQTDRQIYDQIDRYMIRQIDI